MKKKEVKKITKKEKSVVKPAKQQSAFIPVAITFLVIGVLAAIHFSFPQVALIVTQRYGQGTPEENNSVKAALGEDNTEEKFNLYFLWYNVLHEVGHGVMYYNGDTTFNNAEAEQMVNDFAYAYWDFYGENEKLDEVEKIINYAQEHIQNEEGRKMNYMEYAKKNWYNQSFYTFDNYGYFQFSSVKETYKNKKDLKTVLNEMGITDADLSKKKTLNYDTITEEVCNQILRDAIDNIHEWGLEFPQVEHKYITNPYYSYFQPFRRDTYYLKILTDKTLSDEKK